MRIAMFTNNYLPRVGGVSRSVDDFTKCFREKGNEVRVVAPRLKGQQKSDVLVPMPAIQSAAVYDMAMPLPIPGILFAAMKEFEPEIIHSHHPFLLGNTALLTAARHDLPLVFTHHTLYENYTHYAPVDSPQLKQYFIDLSVGYANLCNCVFAPTPSIASLLAQRGVTTQIEIVPSGLNIEFFKQGDGKRLRDEYNVPKDAFVVGYVGRLTKEKNMVFLMKALIKLLKEKNEAHALIVGYGQLKYRLEKMVKKEGLIEKFHFTGTLQDEKLVAAYSAMDLFTFASKSDTQGLVLVEALAAGTPVVAVKATGAVDVVEDGVNGWLAEKEDVDVFHNTVLHAYEEIIKDSEKYIKAAQERAEEYDLNKCADKAIGIYERLIAEKQTAAKLSHNDITNSRWATTQRLMSMEWKLWSNRLAAITSAMQYEEEE